MTGSGERRAAISRHGAVPADESQEPDRQRANAGADQAPNNLQWRDYELLLILAEAGSIRKAAENLRCDVRTIRERLSRLEDKVSGRLVSRGPHGSPLTDRGLNLVTVARHIKTTIEAGRQASSTKTGRLRIAVTEGLGSYWLMPRLVEFQDANPDLQITLSCDMERVDLAAGDFDIAVQLEPATCPSVRAIRLGTMHLMPFASEGYLRRAGTPRSVDDWYQHRLIWQEADQVASHLLPFHIGAHDARRLITITTNSSSAHFRAVAAGGGIGILPTYARAISRRVRPIDINVHLRREITCLVRVADVDRDPIVRGIEWLNNAFSDQHCPWFRNMFIHPNDFETQISSNNVINLFEGFIDWIDPEASSARN